MSGHHDETAMMGTFGGYAVQTILIRENIVGANHASPLLRRLPRVSALIAAAAAALLFAAAPQPLQAQVPAVVASGAINLGTANGGRVVVDSCGDVYINQSNLGVLEIQAGTGTRTTIATNTNGYNNGPGLGIDRVNGYLYFPTTSQWYGSQFTRVPIVNCVPGTGTTFANNLGNVANYYYATAGNIATDAAGDVFFSTIAQTGYIAKENVTNTTVSVVQSSWPTSITSLASDPAGNLYFTDGTVNVYKLTPPYTAAAISVATSFSKPTGLNFDNAGNLFVSDSNNNAVYEIPNESGTLNFGHQYKVLSVPVGYQVAIDGNGAIYLTSGGNVLKEVLGSASLGSSAVGTATATNKVNFVFNGNVTPSTISVTNGASATSPFSITAGGCAAGTAYTAGQSCSVTVGYTPTGIGLQTSALTLADSTGAAISSASLYGIGLASAISTDPGVVSTLTGTFTKPTAVATDSLGNVYVTDATTNTVTRFAAGSTTGNAVSTGTIVLKSPSGIAIDPSGNIYISDTGNNRIVEIPVVKGVLTNASSVALSVSVKSPAGLATDGPGNLYIADSGNNRLLFLPNNGGTLGGAIAYGTGFSAPSAVTVDPNGTVYVADSGNNAVVRFAGPIGSAGQITVASGLSSPSAVATDAAGDLYVVDKGNAAVVKYPNVGGILGSKSIVGGSVATPYGVAVDANGNLYVTDSVVGTVSFINRVFAALAFGGWNVGTSSTPLSASIANSGNAPLIFQTPDYTLSGNTAAGFTINSDTCTGSTQAPGASCAITATFLPPVLELNAEEDLTFKSNAANGTPKLALIGTGANIKPSTLSLILTAPPAGTTIFAGAPVTFTATLGQLGNTAVPGGTVTFFVNGSKVGSGPLVAAGSGYATTITLSNGLTQGTAVPITATYSGDSLNYSGSTASLTEPVSPLPTSVTVTLTTPYTNPQSANDLASNPTGPTIGLTAVLGYSSKIIPGGSVTFYSGTTNLGTASVIATSGGIFQATLNENILRAGTTNVVENNSFLSNYNITAVYSGDPYFGTSTSTPVPLTIVGAPCATGCANTTGATFTITPSTATITINNPSNGVGSGSALLNITSYGGWQGVVNFTCSGLPQYATCTPYPGAPVVNYSTPSAPGGPTQVQFIINTNVTPADVKDGSMIWWLAGITGLGLLLTRRRLGRFGLSAAAATLGLVLLTIASFGTLTGCGSGGTTPFLTPKGTSNVTVKVTAAQATSTTTTGANDVNLPTLSINLVVQ